MTLRRLAFLLSLCLAISLAQAAQTRYVTDHIVAELRARPDPRSQTIATLPTGTVLELVGVSGNHAQVVTTDGKRGWIAVDLLSAEPPALATLLRLRDEQARTRAELERLRAKKKGISYGELIAIGIVALVIGFVLGAVWLDHRIRVRHGGFRV